MKLHGKIFGLALAAILLAGMAGVANAAQYGDRSGLTPEQRRIAQEVFDRNYAAMESTRQALTEKRAQLDEEMASENPDGAVIERLSREIGELRGKMLAARANARAELAKDGLSTDLYSPGAPRERVRPDQDVWRGHHGYYGHYGHRGPRGGGHWRGGPCCW